MKYFNITPFYFIFSGLTSFTNEQNGKFFHGDTLPFSLNPQKVSRIMTSIEMRDNPLFMRNSFETVGKWNIPLVKKQNIDLRDTSNSSLN